MVRFGQVLGVEELNGADIHRLENIMTMDETLHTLFDSLGIWLEETVSSNFQIYKMDVGVMLPTASQHPIDITFVEDIPHIL